MTSNLKFLPTLALGAALFSFDLGIGLGPETASAQTAENLRCRQCVDRGDIRKGAVNFKRLQPKLRDRITDLKETVEQEVPFYITLDGNGAEQTIATNGELEVFARCLVDQAGNDRVEIVFTSNVDGWFAEEDRITGETGPIAAFTEVAVLGDQVPAGTASYDDDDDEGSAAAPDGSVISVIGEATGLGLNIFGHDCVAIGTLFLIKGTL